MKRKHTITFWCCLLASSSLYSQPYALSGKAKPMSELLFNTPISNNVLPNGFQFVLESNNRLWLELYAIKDLNYLPNLDSLMVAARKILAPLLNSFAKDAVVRRFDIIAPFTENAKVKVTSHEQAPQSYGLQDGSFVQLKIDQDTIRISFQMQPAITQEIIKTSNQSSLTPKIGFLTLLLNNASDLFSLSPSIGSVCMKLLQQKFDSSHLQVWRSSRLKNNHYAIINTVTQQLVSPKRLENIGRNKTALVPNVYGGLQYARGSLMPFAAAGLRFTYGNQKYSRNQLMAMWEPYFSFYSLANGKTGTNRNDFVTIKYMELQTRRTVPFDVILNFSLGYLVGKSGNQFEKNTIKMGLPGVRSGWLQLEPELIFNDLFKMFSSSIKLTIHYE